MTTLTIEEQERRAYIAGDVKLAELLGQLEDAREEPKMTNKSETPAQVGSNDGLVASWRSELVPTHRCNVCGALWRYWAKRDTPGSNGASWNLRSNVAGPCCDSAPMREQIQPLTIGQFAEWLSARLAVDSMTQALFGPKPGAVRLPPPGVHPLHRRQQDGGSTHSATAEVEALGSRDLVGSHETQGAIAMTDHTITADWEGLVRQADCIALERVAALEQVAALEFLAATLIEAGQRIANAIGAHE